jgi:putative endonuclease
MTHNPKERLHEHKSGYSNFTKKFSEIEVVHTENYPTRLEAEKRESQLKGWSVAKKKALIAADIDALKSLSKGRAVGDLG